MRRPLTTAGAIAILALGVPMAVEARPAEIGDSTTTKPAWQWTDNERLEARFDPAKIERRNRVAVERSGKDPAALRAQPEIDGDLNPELFLPVELFGTLQGEAYSIDPDTRESFRQDIEASLHTIRLAEGFWDELEVVAADFFGPRQDQIRLAREMPEVSPEEREEILREIRGLQAGECRRRHQALTAAFDRFGRSWFLRLLYEGVAPGLSTSSSTSEDQTEHLLWIQGGCQ